MTEFMRRRRALMGATSRPSWPVVIECPMLLHTAVINGSIINKPDWRSSGYIPIPGGATQVKFENTDPNSSKSGRVGLTASDEQTTGITMLTISGNRVFNGVYIALIPGYNYIYASRIGTDESNIIVTFSNE